MKNTIKSKDRISWLFAHGRRYSSSGILFLYDRLTHGEQANAVDGRVAYIAGKKLGTAPTRNTAKRRLREAAREAGAPWSGFDVVLVAQKSIFETDFAELLRTTKHLGDLLEQEGKNERPVNPRKPCLEPGCEKTNENEKKTTIFSLIVGIPRNLAIVCISIYRHAISPILPPSCRYVPSCSEYALIALKRFGFLRGTWLAIKRVGRCNPFYPGGYDPVPEELSRKLA